MKTEHKAPEMSGIFKELAENFISFKRNLGFKYQSEEKVMSRFCRFSNDYDLTEVCITKKLAEDWIAPRAGETGKSRAHRLTCVRQFGEYLYTLGYEVYFLPEQRGMWTASFVPYIFTHEQIIALFAAADNTKFCDDRRNIQNCLPVIFRMLYGCGLRVSEALKLQVKDVNLTDGILTIKGAKMDTEDGAEAFADMTVNLPGYSLDPGEAFISGDISKDLLRFIKENKLGKVLPYQVQSGYGKYSAVAFDLEKLKAFDPKGVAEFREEWNLPDKKPVKKKNRGMER